MEPGYDGSYRDATGLISVSKQKNIVPRNLQQTILTNAIYIDTFKMAGVTVSQNTKNHNH